jgi:Ca2+-binding EF-hand superfamily protein
LDEEQKGYITADDIRKAADGQKIPLSNRAIREMMQEADMKGDGKISANEFVRIMLQTSIFRTAR